MEEKKLSYIILGSILALLTTLLISGLTGILIAFMTGGLSILIAIWVAAKIGGLTGDVYGALNEVSENTFLLLWMIGIISFHIHL